MYLYISFAEDMHISVYIEKTDNQNKSLYSHLKNDWQKNIIDHYYILKYQFTGTNKSKYLLLTNDISLVRLLPLNIQLFIVDYIYDLFVIK